MPSLSQTLLYVGYSLLALLLVQFLRHGHWRRLPYFSAYLFPFAARAASIPFAATYLDPDTFRSYFWLSSNLVSGLHMLITYEIVRLISAQRRALGPMVRSASVIYLVCMAGLFLYLGPEGRWYLDIDRKIAIATGVWTAWVLGVASMYGVHFSRQLWALFVGVGIYLRIYAINFVVIDLAPGFENAWRLIRQFDFSAIMVIWLWGFWHKELDTPPEGGPRELATASWRERWERLRQIVRGGKFHRSSWLW